MGRADARSRQIGRRESVAFRLQISAYSGEPSVSKSATNLLSNDRCRSALADEAEEGGPKMSRVIGSGPSACGAERLAGTRSGPDWPVDGPAGELEREIPSSDSGEEVGSAVAGDFIGSKVGDAPNADHSIGYLPRVYQIPKPLGRERLDLVVERHARAPPAARFAIIQALKLRSIRSQTAGSGGRSSGLRLRDAGKCPVMDL